MPDLSSPFLVICELLPSHLPAVARLAQATPEAAQWVPSASELSEEMLLGFACLERDQLVGFLTFRIVADEAEILNLAVAEPHRGIGVGSALLKAAIGSALAQNAATLFLEVRESNARAISFYTKHDFTLSGRRPGYYSSPAEAALCLRRKLSPRPG